MTEIIWPQTLPQASLVNGYEETPRSNAAVFKPEVGDEISRRRSTVRVTEIRCSFIMTKEQFADFESFFRHELSDGIRPFRMPDHLRGGDAVVRFSLSSQPYRIQPRHGKALQVTTDLLRVER